ncbi:MULTISPECIES: hypothetical protein [unclassified Variovorax]|uniref:hypothetical protein n=1 Tax=unclassified Variovorax TaxID=663243 RepID=UPI001BD361DD|nr:MULTISPECIES: hypothetical protein [unclassified Variovorax]
MASAAELANLKTQIEKLLNLSAAKQLLQLNSNTCDRAYEAYVFALCCDAVKRAGGKIELIGIKSGSNPSPVVFRGAPGSMSSRAQNYVYADGSLGSKRFEIHVDVEYQGTSGALHELDVSFCEKVHAEAVRNSFGTPSAPKLHVALECKFYEATPGVSLGRTFVGLVADCGTLRFKGFIANIASTKLQQYFSKTSRPDPFLGMVPSHANDEERFLSNLEHELRKWSGA